MALIRRTTYHEKGSSNFPDFEIRDNSVYRLVHNEKGPSSFLAPDYDMIGKQIYRTEYHKKGLSALPILKTQKNMIYRTIHHEKGPSDKPVYVIYEKE